VQLALLHQHRDAGRGECLGARGDVEQRPGVKSDLICNFYQEI
jgi:hypothetical protein